MREKNYGWVKHYALAKGGQVYIAVKQNCTSLEHAEVFSTRKAARESMVSTNMIFIDTVRKVRTENGVAVEVILGVTPVLQPIL